MRCTVSADCSSDSWDTRQASPGITGNPSVAARALRVPRYVGCNSSFLGANFALADGAAAVQSSPSYIPYIKANSGNFLDQFLLTPAWITETGSHVNSDHTLCITRLRP